LTPLAAVDPAAMFQLRTFLQAWCARGTAARLSSLSAFIGGKTGTSDDFNDAWFAGFSNDITIAVWVGYDNAKGKRTLGSGQTGGKVALPIFDSIMKRHGPRSRRRPAAQAIAGGGAPSGCVAHRRAIRQRLDGRSSADTRFDVRARRSRAATARAAARSWNTSVSMTAAVSTTPRSA
jgi:membrane peptidoglycan carboxypeptidase